MLKMQVPSDIKNQYQNNGYVLIKQLFSERECDELIKRSSALHARKSIPGCFQSVSESESDGDSLLTYPWMMHPHCVDDLSLHFLNVHELSRLFGFYWTVKQSDCKQCSTGNHPAHGDRISIRTTITCERNQMSHCLDGLG